MSNPHSGREPLCPKSRRSIGFWIVIIIAITTAIGVGQKAKAAPASPEATLAYPTPADARFEVSVTGQGSDVILIPGLGCDGQVWDETVAHLKDHHRLHVLTISGFAGKASGANAQGEVLAPSVLALHDYIQSHHLHPVIVGHSFGGLMALNLATTHPEDVQSLIIVDSLPFFGMLMGPQATADSLRPQAKAMQDALIETPKDAFITQQNQTIGYMVTSDQDKAKIVDWTLKSDRRVFAQALYDDMTTDLRTSVKSLNLPVTLIYPYSAQFGRPLEAVEAVYKRGYDGLKTIDMRHVDDSRHFIMLDQKEAFFKILDEKL